MDSGSAIRLVANVSESFVGAAWRDYMTKVIPVNAPAVQLEESRRCFYAGAAAIFDVMTNIGDDSVSEVEGVARLESITAEMNEYIADFKKRSGI